MWRGWEAWRYSHPLTLSITVYGKERDEGRGGGRGSKAGGRRGRKRKEEKGKFEKGGNREEGEKSAVEETRKGMRRRKEEMGNHLICEQITPSQAMKFLWTSSSSGL